MVSIALEQAEAPEYPVAPPTTYGGIMDFLRTIEVVCASVPGGLTALRAAHQQLNTDLTTLHVNAQFLNYDQLKLTPQTQLPAHISAIGININDAVRPFLQQQTPAVAATKKSKTVLALLSSLAPRLRIWGAPESV